MALEKIVQKSLDILSQVAANSAKNKGTIAIVVFSFLIYYVKEHALKPPQNLRHLPVRFSFIETLKALLITGDSFIEQREKQVMPYVNCANGDDVYLSLNGLGWTVRVTNPEIAKRIIKLPKMGNTGKGFEHLLILKFIGGPNLIQIGGKEWKHQRMIANPAFHRNMPINLFGNLSKEVLDLIDKDIDHKVDVSDLIKRFTLESIGKAGFDFDFGALQENKSEWVTIYEELNKGFLDLTFFVLPFFETDFGLKFFPKRKELHLKLARFLAMLDDVIVAKKEKILSGDTDNSGLAEGEKDILTLLIESELQGEGGLTNEELKANLCGFFLAGHETTTSTLTSAIYYLSVNPDIQNKARQEVYSVLGDDPHDVFPTNTEVKNLPYIDQILKETLRTSAPVLEPGPRKLSEDFTYGSTVIPKGSIVQIDIYGIHHNESAWENPYKFDPERFGKQSEQAGSWVPFGGGPNICIGMNFSLMQQRVLLSMLLRKYTWTLPEDSVHKNGLLFEGSVAMSPKRVQLNFQRIY